MLVLSRKKLEVLCIGDNVEIIVIGLNSSKVKLGIVAPGDVKILRKELLDASPKIYQPECPSDMETK